MNWSGVGNLVDNDGERHDRAKRLGLLKNTCFSSLSNSHSRDIPSRANHTYPPHVFDGAKG